MPVYSFATLARDFKDFVEQLVTFYGIDEDSRTDKYPCDGNLICFEQNAKDVALATAFNTNSVVRNSSKISTSIFVASSGGIALFHTRLGLEYQELGLVPDQQVKYMMMPFQHGKVRRGWLAVSKLKEAFEILYAARSRVSKHAYVVFIFDTDAGSVTIRYSNNSAQFSADIDVPERGTEWYDSGITHVKEFMLGRAARAAWLDRQPVTLDRCAQFDWPSWPTAVLLTKLFRYIGKDKCPRGYYYAGGKRTYYPLDAVGELVVNNQNQFHS